jgi:hypothetical protein
VSYPRDDCSALPMRINHADPESRCLLASRKSDICNRRTGAVHLGGRSPRLWLLIVVQEFLRSGVSAPRLWFSVLRSSSTPVPDVVIAGGKSYPPGLHPGPCLSQAQSTESRPVTARGSIGTIFTSLCRDFRIQMPYHGPQAVTHRICCGPPLSCLCARHDHSKTPRLEFCGVHPHNIIGAFSVFCSVLCRTCHH